jgi:UDP-glucose 4-epimerase
MKILVAGGAGYIGSITTRLLVEAGHSVVVFDNLSYGHRAAVRPPARLVVGELGDAGAIDAAVKAEKPDCIMHFAALIQVGESVTEPAKYFHNNVACGVNLLNAAGQNGVKRIVFSSTAAVYGEPESVPITETARLRPANPYGSTKMLMEALLGEYEQAFGLHYAALRYFNVAGAYGGLGEDHHPETHLIPLIIKAALGSGQRFQVYGDDFPTRDGTCVRDYLHVHDLARAHALALGAIDGQSVVFNLGSERGFTVREVFDTVERVTGRKIPHETVGRRAGDVPALVASSQKIARELGWRPEKSLEQMVGDAWEWHRSHPAGYGD